MTLEQSVLDAIEKNQDQLFEILKTLIRFPTENPPGNEAPAQEWISERLKTLSDKVDVFEVLPGRSNVVGIVKGAGGGLRSR